VNAEERASEAPAVTTSGGRGAEVHGSPSVTAAAERSSVDSEMARSDHAGPPGVPAQYGFDLDDERPLPDLPPLPADPRWRVEHLPFLTAAAIALLLCAASVGFLVGGSAAALGAGAGVALTTVSFTMSTLVIAWADTVRPALLMPLGLLTYVVKYSLLGVILAFVISSEWPGRTAMGWGVVAGVLGWTSVQIWWVARLAGRK
jgi:hypothetical protein